MATSYQLALIVKNPNAEEFQFLVTRQRRPVPEKFEGLPYVDRELWDLPRATLPRAEGGNVVNMSPLTENDLEGSVSVSTGITNSILKLGLTGFNVTDAVTQLESQVYPGGVQSRSWRYWRLVEESDFGPGPAHHTLIFITDAELDITTVPGGGLWLDPQTTVDLLAQSGAHARRIGPLASVTISPHVPDGFITDFPNIHGHEYPPGFIVVPMKSVTAKPFSRTNLVIFTPSRFLANDRVASEHAATGDVLISDPGCTGSAQSELKEIVKSLPKKLLVFLTHHHMDHIEGLPVIRKFSPEAVLVAHEATFQRIGQAAKGFTCIAVEGGAKLLVGGHELEVISTPGHTDGHLAFFESSTGTLVVGDHCVGQGSSVLDPTSGGNIQEYLDSTRRLLELQSHVVVPMHGRPNLWPAHLLNGYIKHREGREAKILKAIESGARSAFDIVSSAYADTPKSLWPWALANVKLHVEHLQVNQSLPNDFSAEEFERSSKFSFVLCLAFSVTKSTLYRSWQRLTLAPRTTLMTSFSVTVLLGAIWFFWVKKKI